MATGVGKTKAVSKLKLVNPATAVKGKKKAPAATKPKQKSNNVLNSSARRTSTITAKSKSAKLPLERDLLMKMYGLMILSRVLEERMIQIYRKGGAYFWIGAPGEEAFGVPLGLLTHKGHGPQYDFLHLHYRGTPTLLAMGMDPADAFRVIMNKATDPCTGGRNFSNHYCFPQWNVVPVSSPIEVQYSMAIGTGLSQRRHQSKGVSIITGGDAGTAEGDFASCLIWSTRPGSELPLYITVQNNRWGISTDFGSQHGEKHIADRGKAFGMRTRIYNGNDPIETYLGIKEDLEYIRKTGKPVLAEFEVSRLYGHSSASGANRIEGEECCIESFKKKLMDEGLLTASRAKQIWDEHFEYVKNLADEINKEPFPTKDSIWDNTFVNNENADWRKF